MDNSRGNDEKEIQRLHERIKIKGKIVSLADSLPHYDIIAEIDTDNKKLNDFSVDALRKAYKEATEVISMLSAYNNKYDDPQLREIEAYMSGWKSTYRGNINKILTSMSIATVD